MGNSRDDVKRARRSRRVEPPGVRSLRLEELIREEMNFLLDSEINDRELHGVRITAVSLSSDGGRARLYFTFGRHDSIDETDPGTALRRATSFFRRELCDALSLKRTPELRFEPDFAAQLCATEETN
jgi:ribosome-binding factor A